MSSSNKKAKSRLPAEMRRSMLRNAAGKHTDRKKEASRKMARKKVSKSDW